MLDVRSLRCSASAWLGSVSTSLGVLGYTLLRLKWPYLLTRLCLARNTQSLPDSAVIFAKLWSQKSYRLLCGGLNFFHYSYLIDRWTLLKYDAKSYCKFLPPPQYKKYGKKNNAPFMNLSKVGEICKWWRKKLIQIIEFSNFFFLLFNIESINDPLTWIICVSNFSSIC